MPQVLHGPFPRQVTDLLAVDVDAEVAQPVRLVAGAVVERHGAGGGDAGAALLGAGHDAHGQGPSVYEAHVVPRVPGVRSREVELYLRVGGRLTTVRWARRGGVAELAVPAGRVTP